MMAARKLSRLLRPFNRFHQLQIGSWVARCLLAIWIAQASPVPALSQEISTKTITDVKAAVFPVVCGALNQEDEFRVLQMVGSGFLINPRGDFLTAGHVTDDLNKYASANHCFGAIFLAVANEASRDLVTTRWFRISSCQTNHQLDLAACSLTQNPHKDASLRNRIATLHFDGLFQYADGTSVAFTGFPLEMGRPLTSKGSIAARYPQQLVVDKSAWPGASGSPVYTANGKVIGLVTQAGLGVGSGLAYAVPSDTIIEFLGKAKIPFER